MARSARYLLNDDEISFDFGRYVRALRRRWWVVPLAAMLGLAVVPLRAREASTGRADARIVLDVARFGAVLPLSAPAEAEQLRSRSFQKAVATRLRLPSVAFAVAPIPNTQVIAISATADDARAAADRIDGLLAEYRVSLAMRVQEAGSRTRAELIRARDNAAEDLQAAIQARSAGESATGATGADPRGERLVADAEADVRQRTDALRRAERALEEHDLLMASKGELFAVLDPPLAYAIRTGERSAQDAIAPVLVAAVMAMCAVVALERVRGRVRVLEDLERGFGVLPVLGCAAESSTGAYRQEDWDRLAVAVASRMGAGGRVVVAPLQMPHPDPCDEMVSGLERAGHRASRSEDRVAAQVPSAVDGASSFDVEYGQPLAVDPGGALRASMHAGGRPHGLLLLVHSGARRSEVASVLADLARMGTPLLGAALLVTR